MTFYPNPGWARWAFIFTFFLMYAVGSAQVVVLDPGHGYTSSGGNPDGRTDTEHSTALAVGLKVRDLIESSCAGWTVRMTRTTRNGWTTLTQRRTLSNSWGADRFISIHCNAGGGTGTETFWSNSSNSPRSSNIAFANEVQNRMVEKGQWVSRRVAEDRLYLGYRLGVLNGNNAVGNLSEIGFVDSPDRVKLLNDTWRDRFAEAYYVALINSLGTPCTPPSDGGGSGGGGAPSGDQEIPTTSISGVGGTSHTGDFQVSFTDNDNVGVARRFYQVLEKYGSNWYANRGNGFFNDNFNVFYGGYTLGAGSWSVSDGHLLQSDISSDNTKLSSFVSQASGLPYMYEFSAKMISTTGPKKFGIHIMADDATQSQRGNSYLIWFAGDNKVRVYKTINNQLNLSATEDVTVDNDWAKYRITYSPGYGVLQVFKNNQLLLKWIDPDPIKIGSSISLRTNQSQVEFDDLKVYKFRSASTLAVTAGTAVTKDARRASTDGSASCKIKSMVRDDEGNWSLPGNLDVVLNFSNARLGSQPLDDLAANVMVYPNPIDGSGATLEYLSTGFRKVQLSLMDLQGRLIDERVWEPKQMGWQQLKIDEIVGHLAGGSYVLRVRQGGDISTLRLIKK
ncbi:MAG: N-acetylmuramoyl-L-alanine amidase [Bacteroidota bacterium]